jgi:hypothetical protein
LLFLPLTAALLVPLQAAGPVSAESNEYLQFDTVRVRVQVQPDGKQEMTLQLAVLLRTSGVRSHSTASPLCQHE